MGLGGGGERGRRGETEKLPSSSSDALYCNWIRSSTLPPSSLLLGHLEKSPPSIWCQVALISTFCESIAINRAIQETAGTAQTKAAQTDLIRAQGRQGCPFQKLPAWEKNL